MCLDIINIIFLFCIFFFQKAYAEILLSPTEPQITQVFFADINGDKKADKIVRNIQSGDVLTYINHISYFSKLPDFSDLGRSVPDYNNWKLVFADLDGNGRADLINISPNGEIYVHRNTGNSSGNLFSSIGDYFGQVPSGAEWISFFPRLRLSGTSRADLCDLYRPSGQIWCHANNGAGFNSATLFTQTGVAAPSGPGSGWIQNFADINGDGLDDYVDLNAYLMQLYVHSYSQVNRFSVASTNIASGPDEVYEHQYYLADTTGDGKADLIQLNLRTGDFITFPLDLKNGNLTFGTVGYLRASAPYYQLPIRERFNVESNVRSLNALMWYDIDYLSAFTNRGDTNNPGWFRLFSSSPSAEPLITNVGQFRSVSPILKTAGHLYNSDDPRVIRQHAYWLRAIGIDGIVIDWTNINAGSDPYYAQLITAATDKLLQQYQTMKELIPPKIIIAIRINTIKNAQNEDTEDLKGADELANKIKKDFIDKYGPELFGFFNDGGPDRLKPLLIVFPDKIGDWVTPRKLATQDFNIRYAGGQLSYRAGFAEYYPTQDYKIWKNDFPYWSFWESIPSKNPTYTQHLSPDEKHLYSVYHNYSAVFRRLPGSPSILEQGSAWISIFQGNLTDPGYYYAWDGSDIFINGESTIRRTSKPLRTFFPRIALINRFNYPRVWAVQPAEGMSGNKSGIIEPSVQLGYQNMEETAHVVHELKAMIKNPPTKPVIDGVSCCSGVCTVLFSSSNFPLQTLISTQQAGSTTDRWNTFDINSKRAPIPTGLVPNPFWLRTRNVFGISEATLVTNYTYSCVP